MLNHNEFLSSPIFCILLKSGLGKINYQIQKLHVFITKGVALYLFICMKCLLWHLSFLIRESPDQSEQSFLRRENTLQMGRLRRNLSYMEAPFQVILSRAYNKSRRFLLILRVVGTQKLYCNQYGSSLCMYVHIKS